MSKKRIYCHNSEKNHVVKGVFHFSDDRAVCIDFRFSTGDLAEAFIALLDAADIDGSNLKKSCSRF